MPKPTRTRAVTAAQVRSYAGKAQEFADAAANEFASGRFIAATSLAIAGPDGDEVQRDLRRLLPLKTTTEYEPDDVSQSTALKATERAARCAQTAWRVANTLP